MKIYIISKDKSHATSVSQTLTAGNPQRQTSILVGDLTLLAQDWGDDIPDLMVIDDMCPTEAESKILEKLGLLHPAMAIVLLCQNTSSEFLINMMHIGVKDVLPLPVVPEALLATVARIEHKNSLAATNHKHAKIIAFIACKGGSGSTFLATNLAYILASSQISKVALFDLNLQFGDASLFISDQIPPNTLGDVAANISRLDASFLNSSMLQILPNLGVLPAPEDPEHAIEVKPSHIEALLNLSRTQYDYVILDIGRELNATTVMALDKADMIFLTLQETLPFIRDAKRLLHALHALGYGKDKINLLVNRYEKGGEIQLEDVERTLAMKVYKTVPNSFKAVSASVNQGVPIMKIAPHDPVTKSLQEIASTLGSQPQAKSGGWLSHLLHH